MADPRTCRIAAPALSRWTITGRTGRKNLMMAKTRRPHKPSVEQVVQLVVGAVNALAQLLDAIHRVR